MLQTRRDDVEPGGVDAGMAQNVRQLRDVLLHIVEHPREEVPQVMREHLARFHPGFPALRLQPPGAAIKPLPEKQILCYTPYR